jgi:E3 ubiquitin-protein ligase RNF216
MVQLGDIIEIDSSPEHTPRPTTHRSREKGKGKATPYRLGPPSSVIELTDTESESEGVKASTSCRVRPSHSNLLAGPGPSSPSYSVRPAVSLDNISTPTQRNSILASGSGSGGEACPKEKLNGHIHNPPLFLLGDEEDGSPAPDIGSVEANVTSSPVIEQEPPTLIPEAPPQRQDPIPIENIDPSSTAVAQILEIIPNVEPDHLLQLIETHLPTYSVFHGNRDPDINDGEGAAAGEREAREATVEEQVQGVVGRVLHLLFENPDYPKADLRAGGKRKGKSDPDDEVNLEGKGKGKATDSSSKKLKIDYASIDRPFPGGPNYFELALVCPFLPQPTTLL